MLVANRIEKVIRNMLPMGFSQPLYARAHVLSSNEECDPEILAINALSVAMATSPRVPWTGPIGAIRIGKDGKGRLRTSLKRFESIENILSDDNDGIRVPKNFDALLCASRDGIVLLDGESKGSSLEDVIQGFRIGAEEIRLHLLNYQDKISNKSKSELAELHVAGADPVAARTIYAELYDTIFDAVMQKQTSSEEVQYLIKGLKDQIMTKMQQIGRWRSEVARIPGSGCVTHSDVDSTISSILGRVMLEAAEKKCIRHDGRALTDYRDVIVTSGLLPKTHGSSHVQMGETHVITSATCSGLSENANTVTTVDQRFQKRILSSITDISWQFSRPGSAHGSNSKLTRQELEHSIFLENAILPALPPFEKRPFAFRTVSEISNNDGSSWAACVNGARTALQNLGMGMQFPVAASTVCLLSSNRDPFGGESHTIKIDENMCHRYGETKESFHWLIDPTAIESSMADMELSTAGSETLLTTWTLESYRPTGIPSNIVEQGLIESCSSRNKILKDIKLTLSSQRKLISAQFGEVVLPKSTVGRVIGQDGENLRQIESRNDGCIHVGKEGTFYLFAPSTEKYHGLEDSLISAAGAKLVPGRTYKAEVINIKDFGAFLKMPETDIEAFLHISEISSARIRAVEDELHVGKVVDVLFLGQESNGQLRVSMKSLETKRKGIK